MNAGLVETPSVNVPGANNSNKKEAPPIPAEVIESKKSKRKEQTNIQTEQDVENTTSEISAIEKEIKEDEKNVAFIKEKLAVAEQALKDH